MEKKIKENATIAGAAAAGAAVGAGAVLGVNAAMATPRPTSQADDKKAELKAQEQAKDDENLKAEQTTDNLPGENDQNNETIGKDYSVDANLADTEKANGGIQTSQNVNVHVNHREIITPTEADVTPEVKVLEYQMQINADGSTTDVAVLQVDGHNALAIDATGDHVADVVALDINGDGIYQENELFDVTGENMEMEMLAQEHLLNGGKIEVSLDSDLVAQHQMIDETPIMSADTADINPDYNNSANIDDFIA